MNASRMYVLIAVACGGWNPQGTRADDMTAVQTLLETVPKKVHAVLIASHIANLDSLRTRTSADADADAASVADWLGRRLQIADGLDRNGAAAVVLLPAVPGKKGPRLTVMLPTTDPDRATVLWRPEPLGDGMHRGVLAGHDAVWIRRGSFVIVGSDADTIAPFRGTTAGLWGSLNRAAREEIADAPLALWIDQRNQGASSPTGANEVGKNQLYSWLLLSAPIQNVLTTLERALVTLRPAPGGALVRGMFWPTGIPADEGGANAAGAGPVDPWTRQMDFVNPALALRLSGRGTVRQLQGAGAPLLAALSASNILNAKGLRGLEALLPWIVSRADAVSISIALDKRSPTPGCVIAVIVEPKREAAAVRQDVCRIVDWLRSNPFASEPINVRMQSVAYSPKAEMIDDVPVDHVSVELPKDTPAGSRTPSSDGFAVDPTIRIGTIDEERVLLTLGGGAARFREIAERLQERTAAESRPEVRMPDTGFLSLRMIEGSVQLDQWAKLLAAVQGAASVPHSAAGDLLAGRVAFCIGHASSTVVRFELLLPHDLLPWVGD